MAEISELWIVGMLLAAFAGGAFGSALGALPSFVFTGFLVMLGESVRILSGDYSGLMGLDPDTLQSAAITGQIGFGPVFGPHISFAAGAAATAYSAKKGYMATEFPYHQGKNITFAFGPKPDVLFVGGLFGILGYWIATLSSILVLPWDPIAFAVVISAFIHRLIFKYPIIGKAEKGLFNMKPFDKLEYRDKDQTRLLIEPWLAHQFKWGHVSFLGIIVGILAAFITVQTGSTFLPFGISAATLLFLNLGVEKIPVTHHISLIGSASVIAATGGDPSSASLSLILLLGGIFGMFSALFGELMQRIFYAHADTHLDPPAAAIVLGTILIAILHLAGIFKSASYVPIPF